MATVTILNLPGTNTVDASTVAPVVYSGTTYKATLQTLGAFINTNAVAVTASGNIGGGNLLTGGLISATGNVTGGNVQTAGLVSATGNVTGNYILGNGALLTGVITSVANINSGTSNVTVVSSGGNVTVGVGGTSNVTVFATTGAFVTGVVSANGNVTGGNLITAAAVSAASVSASGNVTGGNLITGAAVSAASVSASGNITGGNLVTSAAVSAASISASGNVTGGNVTTGGLTQTVNLSVSGNVLGSLLPSANITYDLGSATQRWKDIYLSGNTIQLGGATLSASGAALSVGTGNLTGGNVTTPGLISATGNLTSGNVTTPGLISATGNITGGNVLVGNITIDGDTIHSANSVITIDPATTGNAGLVVINGNLQVNGNTTTINSNVVSTNDLTVNYANNAINGAAANGGGIEVGPIGNAFISWLYNNSANAWVSSGGVSAVGNVVGGNLITGAAVSAASVSASGNITGGNILGGANVNATTHTGTTVSVSGNITGGNLTVSTGTVTVGNIVNANGNGVGNIGSSSVYFNTVFAKATSAQYADLAEKYTADAEYTSGTVLSFGGTQEVTITLADADHRVAGVVSTDPAYTMNAGQAGEHVATVALTGRVPCSVTGQVRKGDSMVSAGNGVARAEANPAVSTVIGKSLEDFDGESGMIEIVVGRV